MKKREPLKEEILVFAARARPEISNGRDSAFHRELSTEVARMWAPGIKKFKRRIQRGEEDGLFPVSGIMEKEGASAAHIANFLGIDYADSMLRLARGGDIHNAKAGKGYLIWAAEHGNGKVKARALAGIAKVAADEVLAGNGNVIEREIIKKRGILAILSREIGEQEAWGITQKIIKLEKAASGILMGISFLGGACAAASFLAFQGAIPVLDAVRVAMISGLAGSVAGLGLLSGINMGMLQERIGSMLIRKNGQQ